jgi:hypothetical protein
MTSSGVEPAALRLAAVCSNNHTKHTNALNVQNVEYLQLKLVVHSSRGIYQLVRR